VLLCVLLCVQMNAIGIDLVSATDQYAWYQYVSKWYG
jgi:hypothetical protein